MKFSEWVTKRDAQEALNEAAVHYRPELDDTTSDRKFLLTVGDIIEFGPETKHKGQQVLRLAKVLEVGNEFVMALDLSKNTKVRIPKNELYNKEELYGRILFPADEQMLKALKGQNLWVRLTDRQHRKFKSRYKAKTLPSVVPDTSTSTSSVLQRMFDPKTKNPKQEEPRLSMFDIPAEKPSRPELSHMFRPSPLSRFIKSNVSN